VSACLLGINCKYSGGNNYNSKIAALALEYDLVPICPEQLGGCATPRLPAEIQGGDGIDVLYGRSKVIRKDDVDVSEQFIKGAKEAFRIAQLLNAKIAIFKARSPSCGTGAIYDGTFNGGLKKGKGVAAAILEENGVKVISEDEIDMLGGFTRKI